MGQLHLPHPRGSETRVGRRSGCSPTGLLHSQQLVSLWVQPYGDGFATEAVDGPLLFSAGLVSLFSDLTWGQQCLFI